MPNPIRASTLSGTDVIRKLVILTREAGYAVEQRDVERRTFLPESCFEGSIDEFWHRLPETDARFETWRRRLETEGKRLRFIARMEDGRTSVGLEEVDQRKPVLPPFGQQQRHPHHHRTLPQIPDPNQGVRRRRGGDGRRRLRRYHPHRQYPIDHEVPHHPRRRNGRRTDSTARRPARRCKPPASRRSTASQRSAPRASSTPCPKGSLRAAKSHTSSLLGYDVPSVFEGRGSLEAAGMGVEIGAAKWSYAATSLRSSRSASATIRPAISPRPKRPN